MTAQIYVFPKRSEELVTPSSANRVAPAVGDRSERKERFDLQYRAQVHALREKVGRKPVPRLKSLEDTIRVAQRIGERLAEIKKSERKIGEIAEKAGLALKHLPRFRLDHDKPAAEWLHIFQTGKGQRPTAAISGYARLSDACAEALGRDADEALFDLFLGTSLLTEREQADDPAERLVWLLEYMARLVAKRTDLKEFFASARKVTGVLDLVSGSVRTSVLDMSTVFGTLQTRHTSGMALLFQERYQDWFEHYTEAPPLPRVPLVRILSEPTLQGPASVEVEAVAPVDAAAERAIELARASEIGACEERTVTVSLWRDIALTIGPTTSPDQIGPMFSELGYADVVIDEEPGMLAVPWALNFKIESGARLVRLNTGWHRVICDLDTEDEKRLFPHPFDGGLFGGVEHYYMVFHPVNAGHVRFWLDRHEQANVRICVPELGRYPMPTEYHLTTRVAQAIERALHSGALEEALIADVGRLKRLVDERLVEYRDTLDRETESLVKRWRDNENKRES